MKIRPLLQHFTFRILLFTFFIGTSFLSYTQLPDCGKYYVMLSNGRFNTVDPVSNTTTLNSIILPAGASGLAVSNNYFNSTPSPTYYTVVNGIYYYYNGSTWVSTGHSTGNSAAVNPGGAGPYIYNLDGINAKLYRYDGTGNSTLFLNLGSWSGPFDVMGDASGNVYLLHTGAPQALNMYDVNANLVCSYSLVNMPIQTYGGGYSIVNGIVYTQAGTGSYKGIISGTTITFSPLTITGTATDFANCAFPPINLTIAAPSVLTCTINSTQLSATTSITAPQFNWSGPGIVSGGNTATPTINQPGTYTLTVTSGGGGGCAGSATQQVIVTQTSSLTITGITTDVSCSGSVIPGVNITVTGGSNYTYSWSNGATTEDISNVPAGTYTVNVSSQNGCSNSATFTVGTSASALTTNITSTNPSFCIGGSTDLTATTTGGTSPYTYAWNNGLPATNSNTVTPSTTTTYNCTITDNLGCSGSASTTVTVNPLPTINAGIDQTLCNGATTSLSGSGGTTYSWSNGITNGTTFTPSLGTTTYTLTGTDANGCTNTDAVNITVNSNPTPIISGTASYCQGHNASIDAGAGYINYTWSTGANTQTTNVTTANNPITVTVTNSSNCSATSAPFNVIELTTISTTSSFQICQGQSITIHGVSQTTSGTYSQTFPSIGGCDSTSNVTLTVNPIPTISAGIDQTVCSGTSVTLNGAGAGTGGIYTWDNGISDNVSFIQTPGTITYTVTGTDANGCSSTDQANITVNSIPVVNAGIDQTICLGDNVTLTATNPNGAVITWNNGITDGIPFSVTTTMTFTVTADLSGCQSTDQVIVTVNPLPVINAGTDQTLCAGTPVTLNASGAVTYTWNNGVPNNVPFTQTAGTTTYTVTGTDANGCTNTDAVDVTVNSIPVVNAGADQSICIGTQVTLTATGSTTYTWDNSVTNGTAFTPALGATTYTVSGTTSGCTSTDQVIVTVNPNPTVSATTDTVLCEHQSIILVGSGASNYSWNNGITNGVAFTPTATTTYTVTGTDANGCINTDDVVVTIIPTPLADFASDKFIGCSPLAFNLTNNSIGNLTDCKWTLSNGQTFIGCGSVSDTLFAVGCYDVTLLVTTPEGCTNTLTKSNYICVAPDPVAKFYTDPNQLSTLIWKANMANVSTGATTYEWNFGDNTGNSTETSPSHEFPNNEGKTYTITLIATSDVGCVDTTTETITVIEDLIYYVPNTFTPDADNFNETFLPVFTSGFDPQDYTLLIFDRWGEILFESHNAKVGWDGTFNGKIAPDATYIWKITFKLKNKDERQEHIGNINLLR